METSWCQEKNERLLAACCKWAEVAGACFQLSFALEGAVCRRCLGNRPTTGSHQKCCSFSGHPFGFGSFLIGASQSGKHWRRYLSGRLDTRW